jgi:lipopolysaccharide/colanic/teichoic acid biosynthesis glycosyltransferase/transposase-like protein
MKTKLPKQIRISQKENLYTKILNTHPFALKKSQERSEDFSFEEKMKIIVEGQSGKTTIDDICIRESISTKTFFKWSEEFLNLNASLDEHVSLEAKDLKEDEKFNIVIEGKSGETSIAEICRRESISQDTFLKWTKEFLEVSKNELKQFKVNSAEYLRNKEIICSISGSEVFDYLENYLDFSSTNLFIHSDEKSKKLDQVEKLKSIVTLKKINNIRYINKHFEKVNGKLEQDGIFVGCLETFTARKNRKKINAIPVLSSIYFFGEFFFKRILPKLSYSKKYYFDFTKGQDRLLSKAEGLGRLVSSGFKIMDFKTINGLIYFVVKKETEPSYDLNPSYGPIYRMPRLGKNGKIIKVFKFRTMHPYSEYLQDYVLRVNGYAESGKPAEDFRIPAWGKFMRKIWLDELPQLLNVLNGDMKMVGIRPVSQRYFQDIPKEMQKLRLTQKPGCIPPYVALNRKGNVMSVLQSEKDYLEEKIRHPYTTDTKYFINAIINIVFKHKRSA